MTDPRKVAMATENRKTAERMIDTARLDTPDDWRLLKDAIKAALDEKDAKLDIATAALSELWNRFDSGCESAYHDPEASFRNGPDYPGGCPVCAGTNQGKIARVAQAALAKIGADDE